MDVLDVQSEVLWLWFGLADRVCLQSLEDHIKDRVLTRPAYGTLSFLGYVMTNDTTAPNHGSRGLEEFLQAQQEAEVQ